MRVLVSSTAGHGHVLPMVPLARALVTAGHEVLWATGADAVPLVAEAGLHAVPAGATQAAHAQARLELVATIPDVAPERRGETVFPQIFGRFRTPLMVADLLPLAREWRPDLLLHEQGELAAPLVGRLLGLPHVVHAFGGASPAGQIAASAALVAGLWAEHGLDVPPYAGCYEHLYLDICPPSVQTVDVVHIPVRKALRPGTYAGPVAAGVGDELAGSTTPLVYLTLGTVQNRGPLFRSLLAGLADLDVRVLVTLGKGVDPSSVGPQPERVLVRDYMPQAAVLPHASVVVSHGGSGTVLATLSHALPQACAPQAADQFRNGAGITRAGAGLSLPPDRLTPATLAATVRTLLDDPAHRQGARRVADEIAAMPTPDEVVGVLEALV